MRKTAWSTSGVRWLLPVLLVPQACSGCEGDPVQSLQPASISVDIQVVDFGDVPVGSSATRAVTVTNGGEQNLEIAAVVLAQVDQVFLVPNTSRTLEPFGQWQFDVRFSPFREAAFTGRIIIESDAENAPRQPVDLLGNGTACESCTSRAPARRVLEVVSSGTRMSGGGLRMDMQVGHSHAQGAMQQGSRILEGAAAVKP